MTDSHQFGFEKGKFMAKDDYYVVVYQILSYLYSQLKKGEPVIGARISDKSDLFSINRKYWTYIIVNMYGQGFIDGLSIVPLDGGDYVIGALDDCYITPKGIDYLTDNSFLKKATSFLKSVKAIVPFV